MVLVCRKHVKDVLNKYSAPHVKKVTVKIPCHYCNEPASYKFYFSHMASKTKFERDQRVLMS